ncbi:MAG: response regulator [Acidobacteriota bacterium]|nr:response regulator [Acidobacteriota bacterium]
MARILVVEDSPDIRALVRMLLEPAGHQVFTANDGQEGVTAARRLQPDLVLMDLSLPVLSGWEATRAIKSAPETARIPVIAVTAHAMQGDRERALAAGCDGFVAKPIDGETFASVVSSFLQATGAGPPQPAAAKLSSGADEAPARVLVVDDQPEVAEVLAADLTAEGLTVVSAASAVEALEIFRRDSSFDLAIVDVMLGNDTGYELTSQLIASSGEYLPVLLVTAGTIDRERGYAAGADDFIGKPIESAELRARARSLIRIGRAIRMQGRTIRERAEAYDKLAELDRLKSDFLSTVSHELRTPLNTIILLSHLIEREGRTPADEERRLHDVRVIRDSAETLLRMINNILDLAKLEAGQRDLHPQRIELASFLRETGDMLEPQAAAKGIRLALDLSPDLPETAILDREKLSRVLINLLSNGVKYTKEGAVTLRATPWQDSLAFEVEDTGSGVPAHLIASAFEPFRQIRTARDEAPRGTGLGLSISKQLVELMGGDLLFDSREGEGTRVSITLPQLPFADAAEPAGERWKSGTEPEGVAPSGHARRVLIVEDDASSRYGLKSLLESEGYEVVEANDLAQAAERIASRAPEVVVLDITLPDGDGAAWLAGLREKGPVSFPVIALTGVTADEDRRRIERAGVAAVLHKPVNVHMLFDALRECLEESVER